MSYRSIKRVLGENSLERKCRILFGIAMLILIGGSFYWVMRRTENLVRTNTRKIAQEMTEIHLLRAHLPNFNFNVEIRDEAQDLYESLVRDFARKRPQIDIVSVDPTRGRASLDTQYVTDDEERNLLRSLVEKYEPIQQAALPLESGVPTSTTPPAVDPVSAPSAAAPASTQPATSIDFRDHFTDNNVYQYYTPVIFKDYCVVCHSPSRPAPSTDVALGGSEPPATSELTAQSPPVYFMRISFPYNEVKAEINRTRAILLAAAIITAFLSTAALYAIIRYVIVKPLQHLRSVADEVSHGNLTLRSDLNTKDEFEELSKSFNRMLRHLIDTQNALRAANLDLDRRIDEQAQLNMKLYELNRLKSDFLANMSHELKTPLNSIIGFSEVLEAVEALTPKQRNYAQNIRKSGRHLLELINDILDLAKLETGRMDVRPTEVAIGLLLTELGEMVRPLAEEKRLDLQVYSDPSAPPLFQDIVKLRQILINLLSNAIKFTPEGGRIAVRATREGDELVLVVHDTGVGISEADQKIVFEKFRQGTSTIGADTLARSHPGSGLGLSIVKELCVLLGGTIELESVVGKGSIFTVRLPWHYNLPADAAAEGGDQPADAGSSSVGPLSGLETSTPAIIDAR
jgi:signal transduction histidine kinase